MFEFYLTIRDHFRDLQFGDVDALLPSTVPDRNIETLCTILRRLNAVTLEVQKDTINIYVV